MSRAPSGDARRGEHAAIVARLLADWHDARPEFSPHRLRRRADVFVDGIAVECQVGPITAAVAEGRRRDYERIGIRCLWIWGGRRLPEPTTAPRQVRSVTAPRFWETLPEPPGVAEFVDTQVSPTILATTPTPSSGVFVALGPTDALRFEVWSIGSAGCFDGVRVRPIWRRLVAACDETVPRPLGYLGGALPVAHDAVPAGARRRSLRPPATRSGTALEVSELPCPPDEGAA